MPTPRRCTGCGAALGVPTDDDLTIVCTFCGLRHDMNDLAGLGQGGVPVTIAIDLGRRSTKANTWLVGIVALLVIVPTAIGVYVASRAVDTATSVVRVPTATTRVPERPRLLPLADLASLTESRWIAVDAPPLPGGVDGFEPVAALPWAMTIATAWAADAQLTRIDLGRADTNGRVVLSGEDVSGYRFRSPARERRSKQETDAGTKSTTPTAMMLQIRGATAQVLLDADLRNEPEAPAPVSLALPDLLARAKTRKAFADRPFYQGYMIHLPREGWVWYFRAASGDSFPRVRARDGRVYPY